MLGKAIKNGFMNNFTRILRLLALPTEHFQLTSIHSLSHSHTLPDNRHFRQNRLVTKMSTTISDCSEEKIENEWRFFSSLLSLNNNVKRKTRFFVDSGVKEEVPEAALQTLSSVIDAIAYSVCPITSSPICPYPACVGCNLTMEIMLKEMF